MMEIFTSTELTSTSLLYTILFCVTCFCILMPPIAFTSAGITLENIFAPLLGSENSHFFQYHLRRTTMVRLLFSSLLLIYWMFMFFMSDVVAASSLNFLVPHNLWDVIFWIGLAVTLAGLSHVYLVWYANNSWAGHPSVVQVKKIVEKMPSSSSSNSQQQQTETWRTLIDQINSECRLPDKFVDSQGTLQSSWSGRRFVVTNSWILASYFSRFTAIRQDSDSLVAVVTSSSSIWDPVSLTQGGRPAGDSLGTRVMVNVRFTHIPTTSTLLQWSISASAIDGLRDKLACPLVYAPGVVVEPSIVQRFITAFASVVDENGTVDWNEPTDNEQCIGCLIAPIEVVLRRRCDPTSNTPVDHLHDDGDQAPMPSCGNCRCRPMWCLSCMARWFASRLTEAHRPASIWLSGRVPCPTCRSVFCARDVVRLGASPSEPSSTSN